MGHGRIVGMVTKAENMGLNEYLNWGRGKLGRRIKENSTVMLIEIRQKKEKDKRQKAEG